MQRNPYSPPASIARDLPPSGEVARRPVAVWILLLVLLVVMLIWGAGMLRFFSVVVLHANDARNPLRLAVGAALLVGVFAVTLFAAVSTYRRGSWGRWLGLAVIGALIIWNFLRHDDSQYKDDAQRLGALFARYFILPALFAWWAYAFGFSAKAKRYFSRGT